MAQRDLTPQDGLGVYYSWKRLGGTTTTKENPLVTAAATSATPILHANANRIAIILSVVATNNVYFGTNPNIASAGGILMTNAMPPLVLTIEDLGEMVCHDWYAIADVGATNIYVAEVVGER